MATDQAIPHAAGEPLLFYCSRALANFPVEKLRLENRGPARMLWDEHGGTFVLRVEGLEARGDAELQGEAGILLEVVLPESEALARQVAGFAGEHSLRLGPGPQEGELSERPILAASHVPRKNLFIFCEEPRLTARRREGQVLELSITGAFKARRVPCQEIDLVIHLDMAAMSRLLADLLAWAREG